MKRINGLCYDEISRQGANVAERGALGDFLEGVIGDAVVYAAHRNARGEAKTVTAMDIVYALKRRGKTLYGFGP